jgi:proteasome lid subunit RPN8/RPN11
LAHQEVTIDEALHKALGREYIGEDVWHGILLGRRNPPAISGYVLMPRGRQDPRLGALVPREWIEWIARGVAEEDPQTVEFMGIVEFVPMLPAYRTIQGDQQRWRSILEQGVLMYVSRERGFFRSRFMECYDLFDAMEVPIRELSGDDATPRIAGQRVVERFWRSLEGQSEESSQAAPQASRPRPERCVLSLPMENELQQFTSRRVRREIGGILLGMRSRLTTRVIAAVFPPQKTSGPVHCEFQTETLPGISQVIAKAQDMLGVAEPVELVGWVHTHPYLGVFLSQTDVITFRQWAGLDRRAIAVVVDPFARREQRYVCNGNFAPIVVHQPPGAAAWELNGPQTQRLVEAIAEQVLTRSGQWHAVSSGGTFSASAKTAALPRPPRPQEPARQESAAARTVCTRIVDSIMAQTQASAQNTAALAPPLPAPGVPAQAAAAVCMPEQLMTYWGLAFDQLQAAVRGWLAITVRLKGEEPRDRQVLALMAVIAPAKVNDLVLNELVSRHLDDTLLGLPEEDGGHGRYFIPLSGESAAEEGGTACGWKTWPWKAVIEMKPWRVCRSEGESPVLCDENNQPIPLIPLSDSAKLKRAELVEALVSALASMASSCCATLFCHDSGVQIVGGTL